MRLPDYQFNSNKFHSNVSVSITKFSTLRIVFLFHNSSSSDGYIITTGNIYRLSRIENYRPIVKRRGIRYYYASTVYNNKQLVELVLD